MTQPQIWLITGIQAAGKSTIAQLLATHYRQSIHIRGGQFYRWAVNGWHHPEHPITPDAQDHLNLRYRLAAITADLYHEAGFTVFVQDNIYGEDVTDWLNTINGRPRLLVVLRPTPDVVHQREHHRTRSTGKVAYGKGGWTPELLDAALATTPRVGLWIDTSDQTPDQTVAEILSRRTDAQLPD